MIYSFVSPAPCDQEIKVEAANEDDAVNKILMKGAFICRNINDKRFCRKSPHYITPIPEEKLKKIVKLCMHVVEVQCVGR